MYIALILKLDNRHHNLLPTTLTEKNYLNLVSLLFGCCKCSCNFWILDKQIYFLDQGPFLTQILYISKISINGSHSIHKFSAKLYCIHRDILFCANLGRRHYWTILFSNWRWRYCYRHSLATAVMQFDTLLLFSLGLRYALSIFNKPTTLDDLSK